MKNSAMQLIKKRIGKMEYGQVFVISDFTDIADYGNAKKCVLRLEKDNLIKRIIRGVYYKPYYSNLIKDFSFPDFNMVADAIARNHNWIIAPSGITSLNYIGLSTQVVNEFEFHSSGPNKIYVINGLIIRFKHKTQKDLVNLSYKSSVVVQAVKEIGNDIDERSISQIRRALTAQDKTQLLKESRGVTKWVFEVLKKICSEENKNVQHIKTT